MTMPVVEIKKDDTGHAVAQKLQSDYYSGDKSGVSPEHMGYTDESWWIDIADLADFKKKFPDVKPLVHHGKILMRTHEWNPPAGSLELRKVPGSDIFGSPYFLPAGADNKSTKKEYVVGILVGAFNGEKETPSEEIAREVAWQLSRKIDPWKH